MKLKQIIYKMNKARRDFIHGAQKLVVDRTVANYLIKRKAVEIVNEAIPIKNIRYNPVVIKLIDKNLLTNGNRFHKHLFIPYSWARPGKMDGVYKRWLKNLRKGMTVAVCYAGKWKDSVEGVVVKVVGNGVYVEFKPYNSDEKVVVKFVEGRGAIPEEGHRISLAPIEGEKGSNKFPYTVYKEWLR
jgi:hypothetical protein